MHRAARQASVRWVVSGADFSEGQALRGRVFVQADDRPEEGGRAGECCWPQGLGHEMVWGLLKEGDGPAQTKGPQRGCPGCRQSPTGLRQDGHCPWRELTAQQHLTRVQASSILCSPWASRP